MKTLHPEALTPIEIAVWAAEYVRERAAHQYAAQPPENMKDHEIQTAIDSANYAVDDLRRAKRHS
jgi:hypothetical protein